MATDLKQQWTSAAWRHEAETWINQTLRANGLEQTAPIEQQRLRFWSTQLTVPTDRGLYWFKENNPDQAFEARLIAVIAQIVPEYVVVPLAIEADRGWMLSPDRGPTMYAANESGRAAWAQMVRDFAGLQRRLIGSEDRLLASGLTRLAPTQVPAFVEECLERGANRPSSDPRHVGSTQAAQVRTVISWLADHGQQLEDGPVPLSLEHNDLHHNNTFVPQADKPLQFFDFGDALWSHPFTSMAVPVEHMAGEWEVATDDGEIEYVVDAYLEVWSDLGTTDELRALMTSALPFGQAHRLMSWERVLPYADEESLAEFGGAIPGWLGRLVEEVTRGSNGQTD